ncbi:MAG: GNAT family N-acetyltransferase [Oscillospiraceae bacterium]|nr:GNAT family N-acetyltransferase [Oscillospiraceae bacterium]
MDNFNLTRKPLYGEELEWLYHTHMEKDFPSSELKPLSLLIHQIETGILSVFGCYNGEIFVGYYVLAHQEGSPLYLLDYVAVDSAQRGNGIGSVILADLQKDLKDNEYLFIESENPNFAPSEEEKAVGFRRLRFYHRAGAHEAGVYILLFGIQFIGLTLSRGTPPSAQQQKKEYCSLYRQMLIEKVFLDNVNIGISRPPAPRITVSLRKGLKAIQTRFKLHK